MVAVAIVLCATGCEWAQVGGDGSHSFDNAGDTSFTVASLATLAPRWSVAAGDRWSQPVVGGGALYLTASTAGGVKVVSLDVATGATRWTRIVPAASSDGADASPAVAAGLVFVSTDGALVALDTASGTTRWSVPSHTIGAPTVAGALVYLGPTAFDAATGAVRWTAPAGTTIGAVSGGRAIVVSGYPCTGSPAGGTVLALDATTGSALWARHIDGYRFSGLMMSGGSVLIVPTGCAPLAPQDGVLNLDAASGATLAWWDQGHSDSPVAAAHGLVVLALGGLFAVHAADGSLVWRDLYECLPPAGTPTFIVAGAVAFTSTGSELCAFAVDTGTKLGQWTFGPDFDLPLSLIAADGCVYATSEFAGVNSINALCITS
jgi:outer membrane protein assembly factor BamB